MSTAALEHESLWHRLRRVDFFLLGCVALISLIGVVFIASAAEGVQAGGGQAFAGRQLLFICMGVTVMIALQRVDYLVLLRHTPLLYLVTLLLLCGVYLTRPVHG